MVASGFQTIDDMMIEIITIGDTAAAAAAAPAPAPAVVAVAVEMIVEMIDVELAEAIGIFAMATATDVPQAIVCAIGIVGCQKKKRMTIQAVET